MGNYLFITLTELLACLKFYVYFIMFMMKSIFLTVYNLTSHVEITKLKNGLVDNHLNSIIVSPIITTPCSCKCYNYN